MDTKQVIEGIRRLLAQHKGGEKELYDALVDEASGWEMRLQELEAEADD